MLHLRVHGSACLIPDHYSIVHYLECAAIDFAYAFPYTKYYDTQNHIDYPMAVNASDWAAQVLTVRVVCHTAGRVGTSSASDNHWSLYFLLGGGKSVRFNMRADPGYIDGTLEIHSYNYELSTSTIRYWNYSAVKYFTVRMACEYLVVRCQYHRYIMSGGGSGCRWWMLARPANEILTMLINTVTPLSPLWLAQVHAIWRSAHSLSLNAFASNGLAVSLCRGYSPPSW